MAMQRVTFRGHTVNRRTMHMLKRAEARLGYDLTILQGSYNKGVGASAGTHDGGGVVDLAPYDWKRKVRVLRELGFAAWHRTAIRGLWPEHIHAVAIGDAELAPLARSQVTDYYNHRDGLASHSHDDFWHPNPIAVWPVRKKKIFLRIAQNQFKADNPKATPAVKKVQRLLNWRLGTNIEVDGVAGPKTRSTYKKWEAHIKAPTADGVPGPESLKKLVAGYYHVVKP